MPLHNVRSEPRLGRRRRFGAAVLAVLMVMIVRPSPLQAQSQGLLGGWMELTGVEFGEGTRTFGPGQVITVSGVIPYIPWCPSIPITEKGRGESPLDFFPTADLYVIADDGHPLGPLSELKDVNGSPNRVTGFSGGVFVEEVVGITKPAGNLDAGRYRVVMNQCLTGIYDPLGGDIVLGNNGNLGFEVVLPKDLPPIQYDQIKDRAKDYSLALSGKTIHIPLGNDVEIPGFCKLYSKMTDKAGLAEGSALFSWAKLALDHCSDLIHHWDGIAADPPDPDYKVFAELGTIPYSFLQPSTPLERAARNLAHGIGEQSVITQALLSSIEKFQGAQQAGDDEWTMLQMMQMNKFINLLIGPGGAVLRTYAALEFFGTALSQDPLGNLQEAKDLQAFIPQMRQAMGALLDPLGPRFRVYFDSSGNKQVAPQGLQSFITVYLGQDPFLPDLGLPGIPQVRAFHGLPPIVLQHPTASPGGNYSGAPGATITFDAAKSTDPQGQTLTYTWDLDGDGNFNDGAGQQVQFSYAQPGTRLVALKATDPDGNSNVAYALVDIGDVNSQDMIAMPLSRELYHVSPDGTYSQLKAGLGFNVCCINALHVDVNHDIWVSDTTSLQHYDPNGVLLGTITPAQLGALTGLSLKSFGDFVFDGRGDIILAAREGLGPGHHLIAEGTSIFYDFYEDNIDGRDKVFRLAKDASRASFLADVNEQHYLVQTVDGVLYAYQDARDGCVQGSQGLAIDTNGNIVVSDSNNADPRRCGNGAWTIDPDTGAKTEVIPASPSGFGGGIFTEDPWGSFYGTELVFGGNNLFQGGYEAGPGRLEIDSNGNYVVTAPGNSAFPALRIERVPIPPQITNSGGYLLLETFPVALATAGTPYLILNDIAINSSGDYVGVGSDFSGLLGSGLYRVTPTGEIFKLSSVTGPFGVAKVMDVVPDQRKVTPKDLITAPSLHLSNFTIHQDSCPGQAQFSIRLSNTGTADTLMPEWVYFFDGEPDNDAPLLAAAQTPGIIPAGGFVDLQATWASPVPGSHELFVTSLGTNKLQFSYQVCIPAQFAANPVTLSPATGSSAVGSPYTVTASVVDIFGNGVSGVPLTFAVSGANTATGTLSSGPDGTIQFAYTGTAPGLDNIVASTFGATSNTVTDQWQGAVNRPPIASAGPDQTVEATSAAGALVNLSAAASSDPDGDPLSVTWTGPFATVTGLNVSVQMPLGTNPVTAAASDGNGHTVEAMANITVRDTTAPLVTPPAAITIPATEAAGARSANSAALATFLAGGSASDAVDASPTRLAVTTGTGVVDSTTLFPIGATTPVTYSFRDAGGNVGSASANVTVVLGQPRLYGRLVGQGQSANGYYIDLSVSNTGTGNARNLAMAQVTLRTLSGTGSVTLASPMPISIGNLDVGAARTVRVFLNVPGTVTRFGSTETGTVQDVVGTNYSFSILQSVMP